jgi:hypothetical protein
MPFVARTIVEEEEVSDALKAAAKNYPRLRDFWEGWKWRLARGPEKDAYAVPGTDPQAYLIKTGDYSANGAPHSVTILYTFTDDEVHILAVKIE